jgi:hypothetical protein
MGSVCWNHYLLTRHRWELTGPIISYTARGANIATNRLSLVRKDAYMEETMGPAQMPLCVWALDEVATRRHCLARLWTLWDSRGNECAAVRVVYDWAVDNLPPTQEKQQWKRYIYLWIAYAPFEEMQMKDLDRASQVYQTSPVLFSFWFVYAAVSLIMLISTPGITYYSVFLREFIVVGTIRNYYMQVIYIDRLLCSTII